MPYVELMVVSLIYMDLWFYGGEYVLHIRFIYTCVWVLVPP